MRTALALCLVLFVTACAAAGGPAAPMTFTTRATSALSHSLAGPAQSVYWALFAPQPEPQLEIAREPLKKSSQVHVIGGNASNMLQEASSIRFHQNLAWVLTQPNGPSASSVLLIFQLPITTSSTPLYYDTLSGALVGVHIEFDGLGNLWVSAETNDSVYEYSGDFFQEGGNITPSLTLTAGLNGPQGLAFDPNGNLYVANSGTNDIAVFAQPISNQQPYFLDGVKNPGGIGFDSHGNLFAASNNGSAGGATVKYASTHLRSGDKPTVIDPTGIAANPYGSDLAFDKAGNLYDGDCGNKAGIYSYPLATQKFTAHLAPSFYTNKGISKVGCVWGLAVR
jgi:hypothetical protein